MNRRDRRRAEGATQMTSFMQSDIAKDIRECGRSVLCIGRTEDDDDDFLPFAYTIGNWMQGLPELLVIGTMDGSFLNPLSACARSRPSASWSRDA